MVRLNRAGITTVALFSLMAAPVHAQRLLEVEGIELRGAARVVEYGAGACNVSEERETPTEYERKKANHGQAVDVWQLDLSVYNGSGRPLDHLIARYSIEAEHPPCTNWSWPEAGRYPDQIEWGNWYGTIQRSGGANPTAPGETLTRTVYLFVFHEHQPRFDSWSVDYNFAASARRQRLAGSLAPRRGWLHPPDPYDSRSTRPHGPPRLRRSRAAPRLAPGDEFSDCDAGCPEMVVVPAGTFTMGSPASEEGRFDDEGPQHSVTIPAPFAVGVYEVTFAEWDACVRAGGCGGYAPADQGWGRGEPPGHQRELGRRAGVRVVALSADGRALPAAERGGMGLRGEGGLADGALLGRERIGPVPVRERPRNIVSLRAPMGIMSTRRQWGRSHRTCSGCTTCLGNVYEWTQDCWNGSYAGAPTDGSAWQSGECGRRVLRGGGWLDLPRNLRSANRNWITTDFRFNLRRVPCCPGAQLIPASLSPYLLGNCPRGQRTRAQIRGHASAR